jgi:hypothetical protein
MVASGEGRRIFPVVSLRGFLGVPKDRRVLLHNPPPKASGKFSGAGPFAGTGPCVIKKFQVGIYGIIRGNGFQQKEQMATSRGGKGYAL